MLRTTLLATWLLAGAVYAHSLTRRDNNADALIDEFIYESVGELKKNHEEQMTLPDIEEKFEKKVAFFKVRGEFTGTGGWLRDLSTLKRTAPSELENQGDSILIGITLGLGEMEFGFKEYRAEILHIGIHGDMRVSIQKNSVYLHMNVTFDDQGGCKTVVDKVEVKELDGFRAQMTGIGRDGDWLYSFVATLLANKYHKDIERSVTKKLAPVLNDVLAKNDICKLIPH
ncbi:uncharacterized protein [Rhodnius prolixus]|uniref:Putative orotidine 5'-phosphate decarboxylase panstrongylus lignarius n=1 Tax=Rhodnius prolixus TaxID=13249 RepID=A0A4P6D846_RHOPR